MLCTLQQSLKGKHLYYPLKFCLHVVISGQRMLVHREEIWVNNSNILQEGLLFILEVGAVEKVVLG